MKRENLYKFLYFIDILLVIGFCIRLVSDYYKYKKEVYSAPFYIFICVRAIEFLIAALIVFAAARILKKRTKK